MLFLIRGWRDILSERHCLTTADVFVFSFITTKGERTRSRTHNTKPRILSSNIMAVAMSSAVYATAASAAGFSSTTRRSSSSAAGRMTRGARAPSSSSRNVGLLNNNNNRRAAVVAAAGPSPGGRVRAAGEPADESGAGGGLLGRARVARGGRRVGPVASKRRQARRGGALHRGRLRRRVAAAHLPALPRGAHRPRWGCCTG
jgi:hypothetical protein